MTDQQPAQAAEDCRRMALDALEELKAVDMVALDVRDRASFTDFMIFASGNSSRHVGAIAEAVIERAKRSPTPPLGVEGADVGEWILVSVMLSCISCCPKCVPTTSWKSSGARNWPPSSGPSKDSSRIPVQIQIISVAQKMPDWVDSACADYQRRLPPEMKLGILSLPLAKRKQRESADALRRRESEAILQKLDSRSLNIGLSERGDGWNSRDWSRQVLAHRTRQVRPPAHHRAGSRPFSTMT